MPDVPDNLAFASSHLNKSGDEIWNLISDLSRWRDVFPDWLATVQADDEHFRAIGHGTEHYDLYATPNDDHRAIDVEVVDELGSADILRLRLVDARGGGCFAIATAGRMPGLSDESWHQFSTALASGLAGLDKTAA